VAAAERAHGPDGAPAENRPGDQPPPGVTNVGRVTMNFAELNRLLLELVDLDVWAQHVDTMLARTDLDGVSPWPYFVDEWTVWA